MSGNGKLLEPFGNAPSGMSSVATFNREMFETEFQRIVMSDMNMAMAFISFMLTIGGKEPFASQFFEMWEERALRIYQGLFPNDIERRAVVADVIRKIKTNFLADCIKFQDNPEDLMKIIMGE